MENVEEVIEFEEGWRKIQQNINMLIAILEGEEQPEHFDSSMYLRLYTLIYDMCGQRPPDDHSARLYQAYGEVYRQYIQDRVNPWLAERHDTTLLRELKARWDTYENLVRWLSRVFNYLGRHHVERYTLRPLYEAGLDFFKELVFDKLVTRIRGAILDQVLREREGEQIDRYLLRDVIKIFLILGFGERSLYIGQLEDQLVETSEVYFGGKAKEWVAACTCPEFLVMAETALNAEQERAQFIFDQETPSRLMPLVRIQLLQSHQTELINKPTGVLALLRDNRQEDLRRMYQLYAQLHKNEGLDPIAQLFQGLVHSEGMKIVKQTAETLTSKAEKQSDKQVKSDVTTSVEQVYVKAIIDLHDVYSKHVQECFDGSGIFNKALKTAFNYFINDPIKDSKTGSKLATAPELLSNFCDHMLRKGSRERMSGEEVDVLLDKAVWMLAYVNDKDMFAGYYQKKLARRLLQDKNVSDEHERGVLARLKALHGAQFTSRMEGMVNDLQLGSEQRRNFSTWAAEHATEQHVDLEVQVLTTGHWPTYKKVDFALPLELADSMERFQRWYDLSNSSRKLMWLHSLGQCTIKAQFPSKKYDIILATPQAAILVLFNDADELVYTDIRSRLTVGVAAMPEDDLIRFLSSLCLGRTRLLLKTPESKHIGQRDVFRYNPDFKSPTTRIKIPLPVIEDKRKVAEEVARNRKEHIDAAIVRIMKARKSMAHKDLCLEVMSQTARIFKANAKAIKQEIDHLIREEYLRRSEGDSAVYEYLA